MEIWPKPTTEIRLSENDVHVWQSDLSPEKSLETSLFSILSTNEKKRAGRFRFKQDRTNFIAARAILRLLLGKYLRKNPEKIVFEYGEFGKPTVSGQNGLQFNISHSGGLGLFTFTRKNLIGVDVELIKTEIELKEIAERFFSQNEFKALSQMPVEEQPQAFFNCWTRKEAFIKAVGDGLSFPLDKFEVSMAPKDPAQLLATHWDPEERSKWSLFSLKPQKGFAGAIAVKGQVEKLYCWKLFPEDLLDSV